MENKEPSKITTNVSGLMPLTPYNMNGLTNFKDIPIKLPGPGQLVKQTHTLPSFGNVSY